MAWPKPRPISVNGFGWRGCHLPTGEDCLQSAGIRARHSDPWYGKATGVKKDSLVRDNPDCPVPMVPSINSWTMVWHNSSMLSATISHKERKLLWLCSSLAVNYNYIGVAEVYVLTSDKPDVVGRPRLVAIFCSSTRSCCCCCRILETAGCMYLVVVVVSCSCCCFCRVCHFYLYAILGQCAPTTTTTS